MFLLHKVYADTHDLHTEILPQLQQCKTHSRQGVIADTRGLRIKGNSINTKMSHQVRQRE